MKSTIICLLAVLAVASAKTIGYIPNLPDITSQALPLRQWHAQDEEGRASFGYSYPGQAAVNVRNSEGNMAGSWSYVDPDGKLVRASYTADQRGFRVSSTNESPAVASPVQSGRIQESPESIKGKKVSTSPIIADESRCECGCTEEERRSDDHHTSKVVKPPPMIIRPNFKMVASQEATPNQYPFMAALVELEDDEKYSLACGASLITPTKILTAAHCVTKSNTTKLIDAGRFQVRFGMHSQTATENDAEQTINVQKIKIHPNYDWETFEFDIAILTLESPVKYTKTISPICLPPSCFVGDSTTAIAMGWGDTKYQGENSDVLRHANLKVVSNEDCAESFKDTVFKIVDHSLCAYAKRQDTCQNDSGGPLVAEYPDDDSGCRFMQLGVVSHGHECAMGLPGIYTRVASFLSWIEKHTQV